MFTTTSKTAPTSPNAYHPVLQSLYGHFVSVLHSVCSPFIQDPYELAYIAAALWPSFVKPVLDEHHKRVEEAGIDTELQLPDEDTRLRLLRWFTPTFTAALGELYPRLQDAKTWADANAVAEEGPVVPAAEDDGDVEGLPRMAKFILVAAFLASTNPAKSDLRMFGRGLDPKKRARKRRESAVKKGVADGKPAKVFI
jgi:origin recognition complex subunit 5